MTGLERLLALLAWLIALANAILLVLYNWRYLESRDAPPGFAPDFGRLVRLNLVAATVLLASAIVAFRLLRGNL